jgi:bifunctional DNA-binding transcriptional regulator/antitoxin component of YhaV-PrlF toxin-antitoxin module
MKVTIKEQASIPIALRECYGLNARTEVELVVSLRGLADAAAQADPEDG